MDESNWAGNHRYRARRLHRPRTVDELREILTRAESVHVLGSRHSFTGVADAEELVSLDDLPAELEIDHESGTVSFGAGLRYGDLAGPLNGAGLALHNLASLPHISVAGAVTTATHGSGDRNGNLATAVAALEMVTSDGDVIATARGDADFDGMVVGLGALGAITRLALDVEPAYEVRQRVFEGLAWDALHAEFEAIMGAGYSVSVFTRWGAATDQVWVKTRVTDQPEEVRDDLFGAPAATVERHPILGIDPVNCTPQLGRPGAWSDRLPHFRMGFTPSAGEEIQSEYLVPRRHAAGAIDAIREISGVVRPVLQVSEIRTIAADGLWLSPQYGEDTVGFHFTWTRKPSAVARVLVDLEEALAPYAAQPHWGKAFHAEAAAIAPLYSRMAEFRALRERLDPRGAFVNEWLERRVLG